MRKFRVWDNLRKKFYEIEDDWINIFIDINGCVRFFMDDDGGKSGIWEHEINEIESLKERYLINFDTGLCDKYRKSIYEGDIISIVNKKAIAIVEWISNDAKFGFKFLKNDYKNYSISSLFCAYSTRYHEIIGNIYETPNY